MKKSIRFIVVLTLILSQTITSIKADDNFGLSNSLVKYLELKHDIQKPITQEKLNWVETLETTSILFEYDTFYDVIMRTFTITDFKGVEKLRNLKEITIAIDHNGNIPSLPLNEFDHLNSVNFTLKMLDFEAGIDADEGIQAFNKVANEIFHHESKSEALKQTIVKTLNDIEKIIIDEKEPLYIEFIDLSFYDRSFLKDLSFETYIPYIRFWDWNTDKYRRPELEKIMNDEGFVYRLEMTNPSVFIFSEGLERFEVGDSIEGRQSYININPANDPWIESIIKKIEYENQVGELHDFIDNGERIEFTKIILYLTEKELIENQSVDRIMSIETRFNKKVYRGQSHLEYAMEDVFYISLGGPEKRYTVRFHTNSDHEIADEEAIESYTYLSEPTLLPREGYTFKGWYLDSDFNYDFSFERMMITQDLDLYAYWEKNMIVANPEINDDKQPEVIVTKIPTSNNVSKDAKQETTLPSTGVENKKSHLWPAVIAMGIVLVQLGWKKRNNS